jgi:hypothetical protein
MDEGGGTTKGNIQSFDYAQDWYIHKNSRSGKRLVDVGEVKVKKRWLFASHRAINWLNFVLPTFGNHAQGRAK